MLERSDTIVVVVVVVVVVNFCCGFRILEKSEPRKEFGRWVRQSLGFRWAV